MAEGPEPVTINYSLKNIPIPSIDSYKKRLIEMTERVIQRMRWRAFFFLRGDDNNNEDDQPEGKQRYGFKSRKCPPQIEELNRFESDMLKMVQNVRFRGSGSDDFQKTLRKDAQRIRRSNDVFVPADKSRNLYKVKREQYEKLLQENVTKHYKVAPENSFDDVNVEAKSIAKDLGIAGRVETMARKRAFITFKDHKENFEYKLPCRLINPAKSEMGRISKRILESINERMVAKLDVQLWKNTNAVIDWFNNLEGKQGCAFTCFDIVEFYPSISEQLLKKALDFAKEYIDIPEQDMEIIFHSRKSLLFNGDKTWKKKSGSGMFDVAMGSFDGAEVCELVGVFALSKTTGTFGKGSIGLYRDDGLAVSKGKSGSEMERTKKTLTKQYSDLGLRITIQTNLSIANFLDVTFNLKTGKHYPYRKPNDIPLYIDKRSNHPPPVISNIPAGISRRLTDVSSDKECFDRAAPLYNNALASSGYSECVAFLKDRKEQKAKLKRARRRNITWFNPPYSRNVETNIGRKFLSFIDKHFPKGTRLSKIFNRSTLKVSYSCMPNMATIIRQHNNRVCRGMKQQERQQKLCNCRKPATCPLDSKCLTSSVVYMATVTAPGEQKQYIGSTENAFKTRYSNHLSSFRNQRYENSTELSKYIWALKRAGVDYTVSWEILRQAPAYTNVSKRCNLCLTEKLAITYADGARLLNSRTELVSKCRHENKYYLSYFARSVT